MQNRVVTWVIGIVLVVGIGYLVFGEQAVAPEANRDQQVPTAGAPMLIEANPNLQGEVKLGAVLPLSGDGAAYGVPIQKAIQLAVEEINAKDGIKGKKLTVVVEDGRCDGAAAKTAALKLVTTDQAPAIIGGGCTNETLGLAGTANENKVVAISPSETSPEITNKGGAYVYRFAPSDAAAAVAAAQYAAGTELKARRVAVISEKTDEAQILRRAFSAEFKRQGGSVALDETYFTTDTEFRAQTQRVKDAKPDAVYLLAQHSAGGLAIIRALKDQGVSAPVLTNETLIDRSLVKKNKELLEGVIGFEAAFDEQGSKVVAFTNAYKKRFAEEVAFPLYMANAYSEVYLLKALMEEGSLTGPQLKSALDKLKDWSGGAVSDLTLDKNGDAVWKEFHALGAKNGQVEVLKAVSSGG